MAQLNKTNLLKCKGEEGALPLQDILGKIIDESNNKDGKILYNNSTGELEATLSETSANYKKIAITVKLSNIPWEQTIIVDNPNGKRVPIHIPSFYINSTTDFGITNVYALLYISGGRITKDRKGTIDKSVAATINDLILITKVVGYK